MSDSNNQRTQAEGRRRIPGVVTGVDGYGRLTGIGVRWRWNKKRELAAKLLADDDLKDKQISDKLGITLSTLNEWKRQPEFMRRTQQHVAAYRNRLMNSRYALKEKRLERYQDMVDRLTTLLNERGAKMLGNEKLRDVPGAATGLVVARLRSIGAGEKNVIITEYETDIGTVGEIRELLSTIASEVGDIVQKHEVTGPDGGPIAVASQPDLSKLNVDELRQLFEVVQKVTAIEAKAVPV